MTVWGLNFVAVKYAYNEISAQALALARLFPALFVMLIMTALAREKISYPRGDAARILALGFFAMGIYMIAFLEGMRFTSPGDAAIILATSPIFTYGLAVLVRQERFHWGALAGALIAFAGVALVVMGAAAESHGLLIGNLLILLAALLWAISAVMSRPLMEKYSPVRVFSLCMPGALPVLIPYGLIPLLGTPWSSVSSTGWVAFAHISVMAGALGFAAFYVGVRRAGASGAMFAQFFIPPVAVLSAWLIMGAKVSTAQLIGMAIVFVGVGVASRYRRIVNQLPIRPEHPG